MKHRPNARAVARAAPELFTVASCNGGGESRGQTNIEIVWFAVDTLPRIRRDAATKQPRTRLDRRWWRRAHVAWRRRASSL